MKKIKSLLYIEDNIEVRENIAEYFQHKIEHVYLAEDGDMGLKAFTKYNPEIVVSDISIPKINGIDVLKKIRRISPSTQFIITTSFDDKEYLIEAVNLQITNYILKPLTIVKLEKALKLCEDKMIEVPDNLKYFSKEYYFDIFKKELYRNKKQIMLTLKEREVLELLIKIHPSPLSYEQIYLHLYDNIQHKDAVKTLIKTLRKKIPSTSIETIYGYGYKLFMSNQ